MPEWDIYERGCPERGGRVIGSAAELIESPPKSKSMQRLDDPSTLSWKLLSGIGRSSTVLLQTVNVDVCVGMSFIVTYSAIPGLSVSS